VVRAQQAGKVDRIGFLGPSLTSPPPITLYQSFLEQLRELGFFEGQNVIVDYRGFNDPRGPFVGTAELTRLQPNLMVISGPEVALQAVLGVSGFIPVVMIAADFDPIARGYITSLSQPGGNITGVVFQQLELAQKRIELLVETFPYRKRLAVLFDALSADQFDAVERTAKSLSVELSPIRAEHPPYDFDAVFDRVVAERAQMVLVLSSSFFTAQRAKIAALAIERRLPMMNTFRLYTEVGGLMSYGAVFPPMYRKAAEYVAKILKGAKPADLPVEQASKFELVVNLKTAKAIGVELPTSILVRADEVLE
jgi:putative ABC transport system substrate-binding protein